ncbi:MAG: thiolase domain-containing protein [Anaerolineales bacterium]|nr:thiolase domain-containing protein [Anaerolineales bacterium]
MRQVAVIGAGSTLFGNLQGRTFRSLGAEAAWLALQDANIDRKAVQCAYVGTSMVGLLTGQESCAGHLALREIGITGIPITRVENACGSASSAFREAWIAVASGMVDVALALGVEKMNEADSSVVIKALMSASDVELEADQGLTFPGVFAMIAARHMHEYGTTREQIGLVAVKNHRHGALNPKAHFQQEIDLDTVLNSKPVAYPLTLYDCCPISDGAAAAVLVSQSYVAQHASNPVWVLASAQASGVYDPNSPITTFEPTVRSARQAYEMAGVGPKDIDLAEVHDCFTIAEILHVEDLGFCAKGEGGPLVESGVTSLGGARPVNASGGLKAKGHPVGATGLGQIYELVQQVRGRAGQRQVPGVRLGLAHCMGGFLHGDGGNSFVHILGK